jgi:hypothetical protein
MLKQKSVYFRAGTKYPNYLPVDNRASNAAGETVRAVINAVQFPSDVPPAIFPGAPRLRLEDKQVVVLLRSDSLAHVTAGANAIFGTGPGQAGSLFTVTSIRKGFAGGGQSLPKQMALSGGVPGAAAIPDYAELFMGFASTQADSIGDSAWSWREAPHDGDVDQDDPDAGGSSLCTCAITDTSPACDTRFGLSKDACVLARLCTKRT